MSFTEAEKDTVLVTYKNMYFIPPQMLENPNTCQQKKKKVIKPLLVCTGRQLFLTDSTNYCLGKVNLPTSL